jgi:hypothetical protein
LRLTSCSDSLRLLRQSSRQGTPTNAPRTLPSIFAPFDPCSLFPGGQKKRRGRRSIPSSHYTVKPTTSPRCATRKTGQLPWKTTSPFAQTTLYKPTRSCYALVPSWELSNRISGNQQQLLMRRNRGFRREGKGGRRSVFLGTRTGALVNWCHDSRTQFTNQGPPLASVHWS